MSIHCLFLLHNVIIVRLCEVAGFCIVFGLSWPPAALAGPFPRRNRSRTCACGRSVQPAPRARACRYVKCERFAATSRVQLESESELASVLASRYSCRTEAILCDRSQNLDGTSRL